ncbi:aminotransferase class V-fold PLP-dependent enzyme [Tumidithrix elongata RA019]|uniref:Aminotransferase class V-fold PLP-dependent enzyme n=1 Tax=Tumidithrix elongata BACA0141 TaxID=2716417 RepID=A0AAW9Q2Z8_9CYAN|nr:aminotransferase class V-fold PLP-dependent enzyme [Tumidithrix elongata RA019]
MNFGREVRSQWLLDRNCIFLNHGAFGATPKVVMEAQNAWRQKLESQPLQFMQELATHIRAAANELAQFVGAKGEDLVFVDNATAGVNAVVRSLDFSPQDRIVVTSHGYAAVRKTLTYVSHRTGVEIVEAKVPFPIHSEQEVIEAIAQALDPKVNPNVKLLVLDHITSPTALIFPIAALVKLAQAQNIPVLVDGAHAPGTLPLNLVELDADWYAGNCHKWLCANKGCGFLYAKPERQADLHPNVISHGFDGGFLAEFDWTGTRDPSAWLTVTDAIAFHQHLGSDRVREHNHKLVLWAAQMLATTWQQTLPAPEFMLGAMATIPLPQQVASKYAVSDYQKLHDEILVKHQIEVPIIPFGDRLWVRVSAQVYNEAWEYEHLAAAFR